MKICYLCQDLGIRLDGHKGASAHVRGFIHALKGLGHEVCVVTSATETDADLSVPIVPLPVPALFNGLNLKDNPRMTRALSHLWNNVGTEQALLQAIDQFQPDMIYERYSPFGVAGGILSRRLGIQHILEVNALLSQEGKIYRKQAMPEVSAFLEQNAFANSNFIVTVSERLRSMLIDSGVDASKIIEIPNGVDMDMFKAQGPIMPEGMEGKIVIGFVGSLKPWHGLDMLIEAFRQLALDQRYHLLIVGDGPMRKAFNALQGELPERVTVTGGIAHKDVSPYIRAMDIAVAPYPKIDQFYFSPLKVLEYMAAGRAIVASKIGQINELITDGQNGILTEPEDLNSFIAAVRSLSQNDALRRSLGQQAIKDVKAHHTWRQRAELLFDLIEAHQATKDKKEEILGEMHHVS